MSQRRIRSTFRVGLFAVVLASLPSAESEARTLRPFGGAPSVSITFEPTAIAPGGNTLITLTLSNPASTVATLTTEFDDDLPAPMVIGGGSGATTCPNGNVSAIGGFAIFALGLGAQIPPQGSCTVSVCVTTDSEGSYTNSIPAGALQTDNGNNADPASADLDVTSDIIFASRFDGTCG